MTLPPRIHAFPAVVGTQPRVLVLGSMPGEASLAANAYYAHPRNQFWPIMGALAGARPGLPYAERLAALDGAGIALWDVLASCVRPGSLDARIDATSVVANDIAGLLTVHHSIDAVFFNGATADAMFHRHVRANARQTHLQRLPSTSPAHASLSFDAKLAAWRAAIAPWLHAAR